MRYYGPTNKPFIQSNMLKLKDIGQIKILEIMHKA